MCRVLLLPILTIILSACHQNSNSIEETVDNFYQIYAKREKPESLRSFYDERAVLEDIISGVRVEGNLDIMNFFDWNNVNHKMKDTVALVVVSKVIGDSSATINGYFTSFEWSGTIYGRMHFTTVLFFSDEHKIIKQVDWINYPNELLDYSKRSDSNLWIN
jgi:hypothetical protein